MQKIRHRVEILAGASKMLAAVGVVSLILGVACQPASARLTTGTTSDEELREEPVATLQDFPGIDEFKSVFNRETGQPRVVLLLSPT